MKGGVKVWHFLDANGHLRDGSLAPDDGVPLVHEGPLVMCHRGLHASVLLMDALQYAPGPVLCRDEVTGCVVKADDKLVASTRVILWRIDATDILLKFARMCALDVISLWTPPQVVVDFLRSGDRALRQVAKAEAAAEAAAAAGAAAGDAAWTAAEDAAEAAAGAAAGAATRDAAWTATRDAARDAQERRLRRLVYKAKRRTS